MNADITHIPKKLSEVWKQAIAELNKEQPVPDGWLTKEQIAEITSRSISRTRDYCSKLRQEGKLETKKWRVGGKFCNIYRLK